MLFPNLCSLLVIAVIVPKRLGADPSYYKEFEAGSAMECGLICSREDKCGTANYKPISEGKVLCQFSTLKSDDILEAAKHVDIEGLKKQLNDAKKTGAKPPPGVQVHRPDGKKVEL